MIRDIITFDGGLSTKKSPTLIKMNEGIICENVELESGTLKPMSSLLYVENIPSKYFTYFNDSVVYGADDTDIRHFAEFNNRLYWSNDEYNTNGLMRYDSTLPIPSVGVDAVAPSGLSDTEAGYITLTESSAVEGFLTTGADYVYAFTIVDTDGIESVPQFINGVSPVGDKSSMELKILKTDMAIIEANHTDMSGINIYRMGGNNPTFNLLVEEITSASTDVVDDGTYDTYYKWYDKIADIDVSRIELVTFENTPPISDLDMLIENKGTMWGSSGDRVYYSRTGSPEYWGALDFIVLDDECTGIGKFGSQILAFTSTAAYLVSGYTRDNIVVDRLPFNEGCLNKHTIVNIGHYILWTSHNGICIFDGSNIRIITKSLLSWDEFGRLANLTYGDFDGTTTKWSSGSGFDISFAVAFKDKYYGVFNNGCMVVDLADGIKISTINLPDVGSLAVNRQDNVLMFAVAKGDTTYDLYSMTDSYSKMTATWKTNEIVGESNSIKKHYRQVELDGAPSSVRVYVDGTLKHTATSDKFMLPAGCFGRHIQFEIETINEIHTLKFQYSLMKA